MRDGQRLWLALMLWGRLADQNGHARQDHQEG
jgi:hypothetical protein